MVCTHLFVKDMLASEHSHLIPERDFVEADWACGVISQAVQVIFVETDYIQRADGRL